MGAQLVKGSCVQRQTTPQATVQQQQHLLAQALIREGMKNVAAGANPMDV